MTEVSDFYLTLSLLGKKIFLHFITPLNKYKALLSCNSVVY